MSADDEKPTFSDTLSADDEKPTLDCHDRDVTSEEQLEKINEVRRAIGPLPEKLSIYCSDATISRYLRARNWHIKKATKMLKETLKWRQAYKPEEIRWEDVAREAETGKIYRSNCYDKQGRPVLVMRPCCQMVWLIDFQNFSLGNISVKVTKETAHVLQEHYPERLGVAILYNPPKFFEQFWHVVKPFLEPKTRNKVKFVYPEDVNAKKIMEELFDMNQLECAFGGNCAQGFDIHRYAETMKEDDKRMPSIWTMGNDAATIASP